MLISNSVNKQQHSITKEINTIDVKNRFFHIYKIANLKRPYLLIASFLGISVLMLFPTIPTFMGFSDIDFFSDRDG